VFRSSKHIYAQVVDDETGSTLAAASDVGKAAAKVFESAESKVARAKLVGEAIAKACLAKGITKVVFDRNGYVFRGSDPEKPNSKPTRIAAVAEAARAAGLDF
jgi:large subunit ribosomal protein L18